MSSDEYKELKDLVNEALSGSEGKNGFREQIDMTRIISIDIAITKMICPETIEPKHENIFMSEKYISNAMKAVQEKIQGLNSAELSFLIFIQKITLTQRLGWAQRFVCEETGIDFNEEEKEIREE